MKAKFFPTSKLLWLLPTLLLGIPLANMTWVIAAPNIPLPSSRSTRWLELCQVRGKVTYQRRGAKALSASVGDRLQGIGDKIITAKQSEAVLAFDDNIGSVRVTENTTLEIKSLQISPTGGRITLLSVPRGIARLQIRPFTNRNSRLQIQTPAGVAGVRGTEFGVSVTPNGKTVVATLNGSVATSAQNQTVLVNPGFYSLVIPGKRPTPPKVNTGSLRLDVQSLEAVNQPAGSSGSPSQARIVARVAPVNSVFLDGKAVNTNLEGRFDLIVALSANRHLNAVVRSPLGNEKSYDLSLARDPASLYRQGTFQQAEQQLQQQLQANPNNRDALVGLGNIAYRQNNLPLAQQRFEQVLAADPNNIDAQIGLARVAVRPPQIDPVLIQQVEQLLPKQLQDNPNDLEPLVWLGYIAYRRNNLPLAEQRFERVLAADAYNVDALIGAGLVYLDEKKPAEALAVFERAAKNLTDRSRITEIQDYIQRARRLM